MARPLQAVPLRPTAPAPIPTSGGWEIAADRANVGIRIRWSSRAMSWWSELLLLLLAAGLWLRGMAQRDEVFGLFVRFLAIVVLLVVLIAGRPLLLELPLLGLALWLPSAVRFESDGSR